MSTLTTALTIGAIAGGAQMVANYQARGEAKKQAASSMVSNASVSASATTATNKVANAARAATQKATTTATSAEQQAVSGAVSKATAPVADVVAKAQGAMDKANDLKAGAEGALAGAKDKASGLLNGVMGGIMGGTLGILSGNILSSVAGKLQQVPAMQVLTKAAGFAMVLSGVTTIVSTLGTMLSKKKRETAAKAPQQDVSLTEAEEQNSAQEEAEALATGQVIESDTTSTLRAKDKVLSSGGGKVPTSTPSATKTQQAATAQTTSNLPLTNPGNVNLDRFSEDDLKRMSI